MLGMFALAGGAYAGVLFLGITDPVTLNPGYMPTQPVPFSHKLHAGELKMDCRYCHVNVQKGAHATIPPTGTCINCHSPNGPEGVPPLAAVHAHVNRGVSCVSCHGRIDTMEKVFQAEELSMAWCIECHREPDAHIRPVEFITKLDWEPAEGEGTREEIGAKLREELDIHPKTNCAVCHR